MSIGLPNKDKKINRKRTEGNIETLIAIKESVDADFFDGTNILFMILSVTGVSLMLTHQRSNDVACVLTKSNELL